MSITVPSDLRYGEAVRAMLDVLSRRLELETRTSELNAHVISAFSEAFNNVVEHAYHGKRTEEVEVDVRISSKGLTIEITDRGVGFEMAAVKEPDLESLPEGGLGIMIIRSLMDRVDYERSSEHNVLTMTKKFSHPLSFSEDLQVWD